MTKLTDSQNSVLSSLFSAAPNSAVETLERALACEARQGGAIAQVYDLIASEAADRRMRAQAFGPISALCRPTNETPNLFPGDVLKPLWKAVCAVRPEMVERLRIADARRADPEASREQDACDQLCAAAAAGLRAPTEEFATVVEILRQLRPDGPEEFANMLDLAPVARRAMERLPEWVGRPSEEKSAAMRLSYRDAVALADDAGPRLFDILYANLSEPWLVLRVLSAVMDRPADRYVAVSELARIGEAVLDDIDRRLAAFRDFNPADGRAAGLAAGNVLHVISQEIAEFETAIELSKEGLWGKRITKQKQSLAVLAETRLGQIEKAVDAALPQQMVRFGKSLKGHPKLVADPDPLAQRKAEGLLAFFANCRSSANQSGYGSARAKVGEKLEEKLDEYIENLLETLRAEEVEALERVKAYMEVAARFVDTAQGEQAGQLVRRRAAAT
jgi:hypothetical protein